MNAQMGNTDENLNRFIGGSFFSKLSSGISSVGDTLKNVIKNPEVQKAAIEVGKDVLIKSLKNGEGRGNGRYTRGISAGNRNRKTKLSSLL